MPLAAGDELYNMASGPWELHDPWGRQEQDAGLQKVVLDLQQRLIALCPRPGSGRPFQEDVGAWAALRFGLHRLVADVVLHDVYEDEAKQGVDDLGRVDVELHAHHAGY